MEIATDGSYARLKRGFVSVCHGEEELGRVVIDELCCLVLSAHQLTLSKPLMVRLAEDGVPIVVCGKNFHPISITLPYSNNHRAKAVLENQLAASVPLKKNLWKSIVACKITHQANVLRTLNRDKKIAARLNRLAKTVTSGDSRNHEAQASRLYWQALFGHAFRRAIEREDFVNCALNYGYSVLRAACARAVMAAGLLPALGIFHKNQQNPFCLVDDLMEPFRPLVDMVVFNLNGDFANSLTPKTKAQLVEILQLDTEINGANISVTSALQQLCFSLAQSYKNKKNHLVLPDQLFFSVTDDNAESPAP